MAGDAQASEWRHRAWSRRRSTAVTFGKPASYAAVAAALLAPGLYFGPTFDAAAFMLVGSGIRTGGLPYRDYWDDKPPGLYLLNALSQASFPWLDRWLVCWLLTLGFTVVAAVILESVLRPRIGPVMAWVASLVGTFFVACYPMALGGGYGESFALPLLLAAVWLLGRNDRRLITVALTGLLLSGACLLSLQSVPAAAMIGLAAVIGSTILTSSKRLIVLIAAGVVPPLLVVAWLVANGAGSQAYDQLIRYNVAFYRTNEQSGFWARLLIGLYFLAALIPSVTAQVAGWLTKRERIDRVAAACLAWAVASLAILVYEQRVFMHYLILVAPPLVIVGAPTFARLWARLRDPGPSRRRMAMVAEGTALALLASAMVLGATWPGSSLAITNSWRDDQLAVSNWVSANTPASATLFVWGDHPETYLSSGRTPASRFIYMDPMTTEGYWSPQESTDFLAGWQYNPPGIIVETPAGVPLFGPAAPGDDRRYDVLGPVREFVHDNYRLAYANDEASVWLKK